MIERERLAYLYRCAEVPSLNPRRFLGSLTAEERSFFAEHLRMHRMRALAMAARRRRQCARYDTYITTAIALVQDVVHRNHSHLLRAGYGFSDAMPSRDSLIRDGVVMHGRP